MNDDTRLKEIEERLGNSTGGDWHIAKRDDEPATIVAEPYDGHGICVAVQPKYAKPDQWKNGDGKFIINAKSDIRWLIEQNELIEVRRGALEHQLKIFIDIFEQLKQGKTIKEVLADDQRKSDELLKKIFSEYFRPTER